MGHVIGHEGPPIEPIAFTSGPTGLPGYFPEPQVFDYEVNGKTKVGPNGIVDHAIARMKPGERQLIVIPSERGIRKIRLLSAGSPRSEKVRSIAQRHAGL